MKVIWRFKDQLTGNKIERGNAFVTIPVLGSVTTSCNLLQWSCVLKLDSSTTTASTSSHAGGSPLKPAISSMIAVSYMAKLFLICVRAIREEDVAVGGFTIAGLSALDSITLDVLGTESASAPGTVLSERELLNGNGMAEFCAVAVCILLTVGFKES
jgi:hypothetical protein